MKFSKVNTFLIVFGLVISLAIYSIKLFIQSDYVGQQVSSYIDIHVNNKIGSDLKFNNLEIGFFPPSTSLKKVKFKKSLSDTEWIDLRSESFTVEFSIFDFFRDEITINTVQISDAEVFVHYEIEESKSKKHDLSTESLFNQISEGINSNLPFRIFNFSVLNTKIFFNEAVALIEDFNLGNFKNSVELDVELNKVKSGQSYLDRYLNQDNLELSLELSKEKLRVKHLIIEEKLNRISGKGEVLSHLLKGNSDLEIEYSGGIEDLAQLVLGRTYGVEGYGEIRVKSKGTVEKPVLIVDGNLSKVKSPYAKLDNLTTSLSVDDKNINIKKLDTFINNGRVSLKDNVVISLGNLTKMSLPVRADNLHTNDALAFIRELDILKGRISGDVDISIDGLNIDFDIKEGSVLRNPRLTDVGGKYNILNPADITFKSSTISLNEDVDIFFRLDLESGSKTKIKALGKILDEGVTFDLSESYVDFNEFGKIVDLEVKGEGPVSGQILSPNFENLIVDLKLSLKNLELFKFQTKAIEGTLLYNLNEESIRIGRAISEFDSTRIESKGIVSLKDSNVNFDFNVMKSTYEDALYITHKFFDEQNIYYPKKSVTLNGTSTFKLSGPFEDLLLKGKASVEDVVLFDESFEKVNLDFLIKPSKVHLTNLKFLKGRGSISSEVKYEDGKYTKLYAKMSDVRLRDVDYYRLSTLGLDGQLEGEFTLDEGGASSMKGEVELTNSVIDNVAISNSRLNFELTDNLLNVSGYMFEDVVELSSSIDFSKDSKSSLDMNFDIRSMNEAFGIISEHNVRDVSLGGRVTGDMKVDFTLGRKDDLNLVINFDELNIKKGRSLISSEKPFSMKIENSKFVDGKIRLSHINEIIETTFRGDLLKNIRIEQDLAFDAEWLEIFGPKIQKTSGIIRGRGVLVGNLETIDNYYELKAENVSAKISKLSGAVTSINGSVVLDGNRLLVDNIQGVYGGGDIKVDGIVEVKFPYPSIDLNYLVDNSLISFYKKSGAIVRADGKIFGERVPYQINGDINIAGGTFADEFDELSEGEIISTSVYRFIPDRKKDTLGFFELNLSAKVDSAFYVKNSLSDLQFGGEMKIKGEITSPSIEGDLVFTPGLSKFKFKGHEFILNEGRINFESDRSGFEPELLFTANSEINRYDIRLEVAGTSSDIQIGLSSDPFLVKEDILSLLTLGVTSDISQGLDSSERQSVTTLGISTLLVDQLKINEGLSSSLGLRLSVLPEFGENEDNLLQGKSSVSEGDVSRYKSSTKVKVQKKINKAVDLSVSSTIGGSLEQKQEMNLNYSINNNLSIEGVYEIKSSNEETIDSPDSIGADIKYKWSF